MHHIGPRLHFPFDGRRTTDGNNLSRSGSNLRRHNGQARKPLLNRGRQHIISSDMLWTFGQAGDYDSIWVVDGVEWPSLTRGLAVSKDTGMWRVVGVWWRGWDHGALGHVDPTLPLIKIGGFFCFFMYNSKLQCPTFQKQEFHFEKKIMD